MLCASSNRRRQFSYHTEYFRVLSVFSWKKLTQTQKSVSNMASSDSHINKPQRGRPKIAEKLDVNINTGTQSIKAREKKQHWRLVQTYDASISISTRKSTFEPGRHKHKRAYSCALRHPGSHVLFLVLMLMLASYVWTSLDKTTLTKWCVTSVNCPIRLHETEYVFEEMCVNQPWQNNLSSVNCPIRLHETEYVFEEMCVNQPWQNNLSSVNCPIRVHETEYVFEETQLRHL